MSNHAAPRAALVMSDADAPVPNYPPARALHGRRVGRPLRAGHVARLERLLPALAIPDDGLVDPAVLFNRSMAALTLEIGYGGGEHLAAEAARAPDRAFIGCEPFRNGVARMVELVETLGLGNVRLFAGDAGGLIERLPSSALERVDLLYPDPWPKRRHRERRFVSDENLARLARAMRRGAELRFATDIDDYAGWTLARILPSRDFAWTARESRDWARPWHGWTSTRYEAKALAAGRRPVYLTFVRT